MTKNLIILGLAFVAVTALLIWGQSDSKPDLGLDLFGQCLRDKEVTMYGAEWCKFCDRQKQLFGSAFELVPYVECPKQPKECLAKGVNGYPTWIFPNGEVAEGFQSLEKLAEKSGCTLEISN
jgi:hypothetical protein